MEEGGLRRQSLQRRACRREGLPDDLSQSGRPAPHSGRGAPRAVGGRDPLGTVMNACPGSGVAMSARASSPSETARSSWLPESTQSWQTLTEALSRLANLASRRLRRSRAGLC